MMKPESCKRICADYRGENLYVVVGKQKIQMSTANMDSHLTEAGLDLVASLCSELLDAGWTMDELAGLCAESSFSSHDLPGILSDALVK